VAAHGVSPDNADHGARGGVRLEDMCRATHQGNASQWRDDTVRNRACGGDSTVTAADSEPGRATPSPVALASRFTRRRAASPAAEPTLTGRAALAYRYAMIRAQIRTLVAGIVAIVLAAPGCEFMAPQATAPSSARPAPSGGASSAARAPQWTYPESNGSWDFEGSSCKKAAPPQQSPINFGLIPSPQPLAASVVIQGRFDPRDQNVVFMAPTISINPAPDTQQMLAYTPTGFHFHRPIEHQVTAGSEYFASLEMHVKTRDQHGGTAVFAVFWAVGTATDPTLTAVQQAIASHTGVDLGPVLNGFASGPFYSYLGSLTAPPCSPNIRWYVLKAPLVAGKAQIDALEAALATAGLTFPNNRTPQTLTSPPPSVWLVSPGR
jgi:carbonic anhydrase